MKKRLIPALSIGIVVFLIGSLAYAADKRKKAHTVDLATDKTHEEEALKAELLNAVEEKEQKLHDAGDSGKVAADRSNKNKGPLESKK
jgi:Mg2+/citrate symporter